MFSSCRIRDTTEPRRGRRAEGQRCRIRTILNMMANYQDAPAESIGFFVRLKLRATFGKQMAGNTYKLLELKLRQSHGTEFQNFFAKFMGSLSPGDYVPIRSLGSYGDGGVDGFLDSRGRVYQCYGSFNGKIGDVRKIKAKIREDFRTARQKQPHMVEWCFAHNVIEGLPEEIWAVCKEIEAEASRDRIAISIFGPDRFRETCCKNSFGDPGRPFGW